MVRTASGLDVRPVSGDPIKGANAQRWRNVCAPLIAMWTANAAACWICDKPIDYTADRRRHPDSLHVDPVLSRKTYPDLAYAPSNLRPAHRHCNLSRGDRPAQPHRITTRRW